MRVLRVESSDQDEAGMYYSGHSPLVNLPMDCGQPSHQPSPYMDGMRWFKGKQYGFRDARQLVAWLCKRERDFLAGEGFHVVEYETDVKTVSFGNHQLAFYKMQSELLRTFPISSTAAPFFPPGGDKYGHEV